ncbi:MAG: ABC transporter ATP-binding protein [Hyphomicrobiales bacterium]|nr:ABC transporter ATP-binding protein [Hyphomicrobiales bacterium]
MAQQTTGLAREIIAVEHVGKTYGAGTGAFTALRDISFGVREGEFVTLVGPSGCGKSTLLQILAGLVAPSAGRAVIDGQVMIRPVPEKVGVMFQDAWLLPWKTALENVEFPLALRKVAAAERKRRALPLLELVGLASFVHRYPDELSGGQRQRVAIARCLAQEPRVLLMDEPFAALDEQTRTRMGSELLQIWEKSGGTVVFVTHGLTEAIYLADRVFVMGTRPGRIIERIDVPLPRPRTIDMIGSEVFGRLRNQIWHLIAEA